MKAIRIINIILLILAIVALPDGLNRAKEAEENKKHDGGKIIAELISTRRDYTEAGYGSRNYYVYTTFKIKNKTSVSIYYIEIKTFVYDKTGKKLGYLTTSFGSQYEDDSSLEINAGKECSEECKFKTQDLSEGLVAKMYNASTNELTFKSEVTYVKFSDGWYWTE